MIRFKYSIEDINKYQISQLPRNAEKIETPQSIEEMMKKAAPIAVILGMLICLTMFLKTFLSRQVIIAPIFIGVGLVIGFALLILHEWLHAIVYPKSANVTIGKLKRKTTFVVLVSYPLKRYRFIMMCLLPFILGIIPWLIFILSSPNNTKLNGLMFGLTCMGMISPFPDVFNVITVLKKADRNDSIMFYKDDMYKISCD